MEQHVRYQVYTYRRGKMIQTARYIEAFPFSVSIQGTARGARGVGGGTHLFARLTHLTTNHVLLSRRSSVPTPTRDTSNSWALTALRGGGGGEGGEGM